MPRIPQYQQQTRTSTNDLGPGPSRTAGGELELASQLAQTAQKIQLSHDAWKLADTTAKATGELEQFRGQLQADEDFDTHASRFLEQAKDVRERYGAQLGGTAARAFRDDFDRIAQANAGQVAIDAQRLKSGKVRAELGSTLFDLSQLTGTDPATDDAVRAQAHLAVETNAANGNINPSERAAMLQKFDVDSSEAAIRRDMLADPESAEMKLAGGAYPHLSGEAQAIWAQRVSDAAASAQRRRDAEESRAYTLSERDRKQRGDDLAKQGDTLLSQNQLTPAWIHQNEAELAPSDVRYFYDKLKGGGGDAPRDAMRYADLRERSGRGEDVRDEARKALQQGAIRTTDYDRILGEVEGARPTWYRRGSEYISTYAAVSELNPDPAAAATKATMLDQWNDWAVAHPKASSTEAQTQYQTIVEHNSLVQLNGLPMPREAVGGRFSLDIAATEAQTVKALNEGRMDRAQFEREAALLKRWRQALTTPDKARP